MGQMTAAGEVTAGVLRAQALPVLLRLARRCRLAIAADVRPEVSEQIESMGAEFVFLDFEEDGRRRICAPSALSLAEQLEKFRASA